MCAAGHCTSILARRGRRTPSPFGGVESATGSSEVRPDAIHHPQLGTWRRGHPDRNSSRACDLGVGQAPNAAARRPGRRSRNRRATGKPASDATSHRGAGGTRRLHRAPVGQAARRRPSGLVTKAPALAVMLAVAAAWAVFVTDVVSARLPSGFTFWAAEGGWRGTDGRPSREPSFVLEVVHPARSAAVEAAIVAIIAEYKRRFRQESVLRVVSSGRASY
ncbi:MAG: hypothetical protein DMD58_04255 [Gemmatimonadetes bacterium]|nr:MAG: hypothetical protein DMD58_04255 [Gemmatimonadota bacterium]